MSWNPGQFVPTTTAQMMRAVALEVAGQNCVIGLTAGRGYGKSFLAQNIHGSAEGMGIKGRVAYVEFIGEEPEEAPALRRIATEVGWDREDVRSLGGISALFDCVVEFVSRNKVPLLLVDNAHHLTADTLALIGKLSTTWPRRHGLARTPDELVLPIEKGMATRCELGIVLLGEAFDAEQIRALAESCDWRGIRKLPPLSFEEMAAILVAWDARFRPFIDKAVQKPKSEDFLLMQTFYALTRGSIARFERILRRISLPKEGPILELAIVNALESYRQSQVIPMPPIMPETVKL